MIHDFFSENSTKIHINIPDNAVHYIHSALKSILRGICFNVGTSYWEVLINETDLRNSVQGVQRKHIEKVFDVSRTTHIQTTLFFDFF